jgi:hypothetical protein
MSFSLVVVLATQNPPTAQSFTSARPTLSPSPPLCALSLALREMMETEDSVTFGVIVGEDGEAP